MDWMRKQNATYIHPVSAMLLRWIPDGKRARGENQGEGRTPDGKRARGETQGYMEEGDGPLTAKERGGRPKERGGPLTARERRERPKETWIFNVRTPSFVCVRLHTGVGTPTASQHNIFDLEKTWEKVVLVLMTGFQPSTFGSPVQSSNH